MHTDINEQEIIRYYDNCEIDYRLVWHLNSQLCMHYGYWDISTRRLRDALVNMNKKVAEFGGVRPGDYVLDAGCGVGGSSIFLAKTFNCRVLGITLSEKQVETCCGNAMKYHVADQVFFEKQNYLQTHYPDNQFDAVWAIESVCYAWDKTDFIKEAFRVLKPGGRLVVADFYEKKVDKGTPEEILLRKWTRCWAIKAYANIATFSQTVDQVGFVNRRTRDITQNVAPSIKRLYYVFFPGIVVSRISQVLRFRNAIQTANTMSTYYQYRAYKKDLWTYQLVTAQKPLK